MDGYGIEIRMGDARDKRGIRDVRRRLGLRERLRRIAFGLARRRGR